MQFILEHPADAASGHELGPNTPEPPGGHRPVFPKLSDPVPPRVNTLRKYCGKWSSGSESIFLGGGGAMGEVSKAKG